MVNVLSVRDCVFDFYCENLEVITTLADYFYLYLPLPKTVYFTQKALSTNLLCQIIHVVVAISWT